MAKSKKKKVEKAAKKHPKLFIALIIILVIIIVAVAILWCVKPEVFHKLLGTGEHYLTEWTVTEEATCGKEGSRTRKCTVCGEEFTEKIQPTGEHTFDGDICTVCSYDKGTGNIEEIPSAEFSIHFMELGNKANGDSILIDCGDTEVLIDAGSEKNSAPVISEYINKYCSDGVLEYVISTHADSDHISAFIGNSDGDSRNGILYKYRVGTFIRFDYTNSPTKALYTEYLTAVDYAKENGATVYTASQCYNEEDGAKRQYYLNEEKTVSINILYNYYYFNSTTAKGGKADENDFSVVTLLTYSGSEEKEHYLFTGDLEEDGESRMVDYYSNPANSKSADDILPKVKLYKAGHHGSRTSSTEKLLSVIQPEYVAVCCCCGAPEYTKVNDNTFPTREMIDRVSKYTDKIYVTSIATGLPEKDEEGNYVNRSYGGFESMNGDIVFYYRKNQTGGKLKLYCSNNLTILKDTDWFKENRA